MSRHVVVNFAILLQIGNVILQHREPQLKTKLSAIVRGPEFAQQVEQWLNRWSQKSTAESDDWPAMKINMADKHVATWLRVMVTAERQREKWRHEQARVSISTHHAHDQ